MKSHITNDGMVEKTGDPSKRLFISHIHKYINNDLKSE